jgi:hypothetical protein
MLPAVAAVTGRSRGSQPYRAAGCRLLRAARNRASPTEPGCSPCPMS